VHHSLFSWPALQKRLRPFLADIVIAFALGAFSAVIAAAATLPDWIQTRPQAKLVIITLEAGVGDNNDGLNYNGHFNGHPRIIVPLGWTVIVRMKNADPRVPHSALVTKVYPADQAPERLSAQDTAFPGAATPVPFTGTPAGGYGEFSFAANQAGQYLIACGVQTHLQIGMFLRLDVVDGATEPDAKPE
jgi:Sulfocyanin (SoxE) domain